MFMGPESVKMLEPSAGKEDLVLIYEIYHPPG
jgi:hypothetical protein